MSCNWASSIPRLRSVRIACIANPHIFRLIISTDVYRHFNFFLFVINVFLFFFLLACYLWRSQNTNTENGVSCTVKQKFRLHFSLPITFRHRLRGVNLRDCSGISCPIREELFSGSRNLRHSYDKQHIYVWCGALHKSLRHEIRRELEWPSVERIHQPSPKGSTPLLQSTSPLIAV